LSLHDALPIFALVPDHDHHVVDAGIEKRADDAGEKRLAAAERQQRFRPAHARRAAGGQHDCGDHGSIVIERRAARIAFHERARDRDPVHAVRGRNGSSRSGARHALDPGSVLGMPALRPSFLDDLPAAQTREYQTRRGNSLVIAMRPYSLDDIDEDVDDDDGFYEDQEGDDDEDDEDDEDEDEETWQVSATRPLRSAGGGTAKVGRPFALGHG